MSIGSFSMRLVSGHSVVTPGGHPSGIQHSNYSTIKCSTLDEGTLASLKCLTDTIMSQLGHLQPMLEDSLS